MVYPLESQITWHSGFDELVPYTFGPARITHTFCPVCGTSVGGKSNEQAFSKYRALNVSCASHRAAGLQELLGSQPCKLPIRICHLMTVRYTTF